MKNILLILHNQKTVTLYIDPNISIHALKHIIENEYFIPVKYQQLYTNGLLLPEIRRFFPTQIMPLTGLVIKVFLIANSM